MSVAVEFRRAARFLCRAAWRCEACDSPWFAAEHRARAWEMAKAHVAEHH